jgi:DNA adenine methylase
MSELRGTGTVRRIVNATLTPPGQEVFPNPPLKWFGGKTYLAPHIHRLAPPHTFRGIPYGGALGELWNWSYQGVSEVVNDIDLQLTNLWRCLQDPALFEQLRRELELTPFGRPFFDAAATALQRWDRHEVQWADELDRQPSPFWAARFFVLVRQSRGGGRKGFAPLSINRVRRGVNEQASAWWSAIDGLWEVHQRLAPVVVERLPALEFMARYDAPGVFFYLDPPYLPPTRTAKKVYKHEMTYEQHVELLDFLPSLQARVMLSAYRHPEYETRLLPRGWRCEEIVVRDCASSARSKKRKIEVLWMNYDAAGERI